MRGIVSKLQFLAVLLPVVAAAQQVAVDSGAQLSEVIVTARKTSEDLQHAAVAVTTISSDDIMRANIKGPTDLQWQLPAVEFQTAQSVPDVFIRGVGTYNLQAGVDSAVAFSIDGIYLAHPSAYPPVLVDIAQVEEVRGPQGTLYGRNSNGGAISFISNKPMLGQWDAEAGLSTGNYAAFGSNFMVNVPITATLATRFAIGTDRQDAIWANGYGVHNNFTARWRTLFQPIESLELIATLDRSRVSDNGFTGDACAPSGTDCPPHSFHPWTGVGPRNPGDFDHIDTWGAYLEANLKLSWATITSLSSYRNSDWQSQITSTVGDALPAYFPDGSLNPGDMNTGYTQGQTSRLTTQELRIASAAGASVNWLFGGYFSRDRTPYRETLVGNGFTFFTTEPLLSDDSKAVFGQLTYPILAGLRVTGGLRYTNEKKSASEANSAAAILNSELNKVTWKAGLEYDLAPQSLLYGSVSTGFKSGGVSEVPDVAGSNQTYGPETITAYQIGNKNRFWSDRIQVNYELFYYDYHGFQTLDVFVAPPGPFGGELLFQTVNSQKSENYGGEIETAFAITAHDRLTLSPTFLHARFIEFNVAGVNNSGNRIEASAPYTVAGSYQHEFVLPASNKIIAKISTELVGGHYMNNDNNPVSYQKTYTRTTADVTYQDGGGHWSASVFVRNLENTGVISFDEGNVLGVQDVVVLYPPRTYGLSVTWHL